MPSKRKETKKVQTVEKRTVKRYVSPEQIYPPTTVRARGGVPFINLPRECRDVQYCRYTDAGGIIDFLPEAYPPFPNSVEVTARKDGYRTYAPMPAGTEGIRYRRIRNKVTGVVTLTPINGPTPKRRVNAPQTTYTGTDIVNRIGSMLPCLKDGEEVTQCLISLNTSSVIVVDMGGDIERTDPDTMKVTTYRPSMPPETIDITRDWPTKAELKRLGEALTADLCKHGKKSRRARR